MARKDGQPVWQRCMILLVAIIALGLLGGAYYLDDLSSYDEKEDGYKIEATCGWAEATVDFKATNASSSFNSTKITFEYSKGASGDYGGGSTKKQYKKTEMSGLIWITALGMAATAIIGSLAMDILCCQKKFRAVAFFVSAVVAAIGITMWWYRAPICSFRKKGSDWEYGYSILVAVGAVVVDLAAGLIACFTCGTSRVPDYEY